MAGTVDYVRKKFGPLREKGLKQALAHAIGRDFPRVGGPRIRDLCAEMILDVIASHCPPREHLHHGQALWLGVAVDDPPARHKRIADTQLCPVVLDLSCAEDVDARLERKSPAARLQQKVVRLCKQAYEPGALLSNCDLAERLNTSDAQVAHALTTYEEETATLVPRRATLHDVGSGVTHKRIICRKRYADGKPSEIIAQETYHNLESVDRYLGQFDRVRHCRKEGMTPEATAHVLHCTLGLVREYLVLDEELECGDD